MENKDSRNLKFLEEFELVNNKLETTYKEENVYIEPTIGKTGKIEYNVYDVEKKLIGVIKDNKNLKLDEQYKERKSLQKDGKQFDFDSKDIQADIIEMLNKQKEKQEISDKRLNENLKNDEQKDVNKQKYDKNINENPDSKQIESDELKEQGYNITTWTLIKDQIIIDSLISNDFDPRSIIVAEVDGQFKFLGREIATGEVKELQERAGGNTQAEEVNKFEGNVERKDGRGTTMIMPDFGNIEFNIEKNGVGQIEVGRIMDLDGDGTREVIPIETDAIHPTIEEYKRNKLTQFEKYGYEFDDSIMTNKEVEERLEEEEQPIKDEVLKDINSTDENVTKEDLEEKIEEEKEEQSQENEYEDEREEDDDEWVPWKPRSH